MEVTKKTLADLLKEELANLAEPVGDEDKDKVIRDTIRWLTSFLQEDKLPTPKDGEREDQSDPNIYTNELQTISQQAQENFKYIYYLTDKVRKAINEEKQARIELSTFELEIDTLMDPLLIRLLSWKRCIQP